MVRLKDNFIYLIKFSLFTFQFLMVRLKGCYLYSFFPSHIFQFLMVRLKAYQVGFFKKRVKISIPYGAIKSLTQ